MTVDRDDFIAEQAARAVAESDPDTSPLLAARYPAHIAEALDLLAAEGHDPLAVGVPFAARYVRTYARLQSGDITGTKRLEEDRRRWLRAVAAATRAAA